MQILQMCRVQIGLTDGLQKNQADGVAPNFLVVGHVEKYIIGRYVGMNREVQEFQYVFEPVGGAFGGEANLF